MVLDYDAATGVDPDDIHSKTTSIKIHWNPAKVRFYFAQLEMQMETAGVKSQWQKRLLLQRNLPPEIIAELEDLLIQKQSEAGDLLYKDLKDRLFKGYGPRPEDSYRKARDLVMTGKPSGFAKILINELCTKHPTLENCCMGGVISSLWRDQLPTAVKTAVANHSLVGKDTMKTTLELADRVFESVKSSAPVRQVAAVARAPARHLYGNEESQWKLDFSQYYPNLFHVLLISTLQQHCQIYGIIQQQLCAVQNRYTMHRERAGNKRKGTCINHVH